MFDEEGSLLNVDDVDYREYRYLMFTLPIILNAEVVVETGLGQGQSTRLFLQALSQLSGKRQLYTFEIKCQQYADVIQSIRRLPLKVEWLLCCRDSVEGGKEWKQKLIGLLYLDSEHDYQHVSNELEAFKPHLSEKAVILTHDSWPIKPHAYFNVRNPGRNPSDTYWALKDWGDRNGWKNLLFKHPDGMTLLYKER